MISSLSIFSLNSRWMALVARKTWIRGCSAFCSASQARSMSASLQRASPQITAPRDVLGNRADRFEVARRSDREAGFDDVDAQVDQRLGDFHLLGHVHAAAGRLLAVAQRGVEDADLSGSGHWVILRSSLVANAMCKDALTWGRPEAGPVRARLARVGATPRRCSGMNHFELAN